MDQKKKEGRLYQEIKPKEMFLLRHFFCFWQCFVFVFCPSSTASWLVRLARFRFRTRFADTMVLYFLGQVASPNSLITN
jgi:hypothetical protein